MKKLLFLIFFFLFVVYLFGFANSIKTAAQAQSNTCPPPCTDLSSGSACKTLWDQCSSNLSTALQESIAATAPLQSQLNALKAQVTGLENSLAGIQQNLITKGKEIDSGYKSFATQEKILDATIRDYYIKSYYNSPLLLLLSSSSVSDFTQVLGYQRSNANRDKAIIENIAVTIQGLQTESKQLQEQEDNLTALKGTLDQQSAKLNTIVSGAVAYQQNLTTQIAELNSKQQQILNQRLSGLNIPLFASATGGCSSDVNPFKDPGFSSAFGFFTYGVPNRVGLNQYGAWGRAKAGQDYNQILQAYYNYDSVSGADQGIQITVTGYGTYSLEDYVKRVYEVPDSWTDNNLAALKAQVIAVRSYVLSYTNNGANPICATQSCQVFQPNPKGGNWEQAVNATSGQVMMQGGKSITAWFSSTHGGYVHSSSDVGWSATGWTKNAADTTGSVGSFSDLNSNAYDKDSPWFYCDWGSRSSYNGTAWLQGSEVADIVNVLLLAQKDSSTVNHLYQTDKNTNPNPAGTDTWDAAKVRQELQNRGITPYNNISSVSISADFGSGKVTSVNVSGDAGSTSFSGSDFKNYFNLRAPSNIQIVGPLYNIEQR